PVWAVYGMEQILAAQSRPRQFVTAMLGGYAALALLLASVGIFGVVSYAVSQRTGEIGVRVALGARPRHIAGIVLRQGFSMALAFSPHPALHCQPARSGRIRDHGGPARAGGAGGMPRSGASRHARRSGRGVAPRMRARAAAFEGKEKHV